MQLSLTEQPLVSVVTPVYNGEPYLAECIESVLAQTYSNWEYVIVDNCSTDKTPEIAARYAKQDGRIRVYRNDELLPIIANHNRAFRLISGDSKYCKVVSGDDWLYPECITRMVQLAEANPSVGIVGCYQLSGGGDLWYLRTYGIPYHRTMISGREIGRAHLLGTLDVLGNPTSTMYRADLVRSSDSFYPNDTAEADLSACFKYLAVSDFGFVHQVLAYERVHQAQISTTSKNLNAYLPSRISDLRNYGHFYLKPDELEQRFKELMNKYYASLASGIVQFREKTFWTYHKGRLREIGTPLSFPRLARAASIKILDLLLNPKQAAEKALSRIATA